MLVIWLPVLESDQGPPARGVRKPLRDPRVLEFWDPGRWASARMLEVAARMARARGEAREFRPNAIAWDLILLFPPGTVWEDPFPEPVWWSGPVVNVLGPVETALAGAQTE